MAETTSPSTTRSSLLMFTPRKSVVVPGFSPPKHEPKTKGREMRAEAQRRLFDYLGSIEKSPVPSVSGVEQEPSTEEAGEGKEEFPALESKTEDVLEPASPLPPTTPVSASRTGESRASTIETCTPMSARGTFSIPTTPSTTWNVSVEAHTVEAEQPFASRRQWVVLGVALLLGLCMSAWLQLYVAKLESPLLQVHQGAVRWQGQGQPVTLLNATQLLHSTQSTASDVWFALTTLAPNEDEHALPSPTPLAEKLAAAFHDLRASASEWVLQPLARGLGKGRELGQKGVSSVSGALTAAGESVDRAWSEFSLSESWKTAGKKAESAVSLVCAVGRDLPEVLKGYWPKPSLPSPHSAFAWVGRWWPRQGGQREDVRGLLQASAHAEADSVRQRLQAGHAFSPNVLARALLLACEHNRPATVALLTQEARVAVRSDVEGPLWVACYWGYPEVVGPLLHALGAPSTVPAPHLTAALNAAARRGHVAVVEQLLAYGADPRGASDQGRTPLHAAAIGGHVDVLRLLLQHPAAASLLSAKDARGRTPTILARRAGDVDAVKVLEEAQAKATRWW